MCKNPKGCENYWGRTNCLILNLAEEILDTYEYFDCDGETVSIHEDLIHIAMEQYAKQYALNLFDQYLDGEKTIAEISQELKQE